MSGVGPRSANTYNIAPPSNYVAGVGRGALGFTTRSDIGPARPAPPTGPNLGGADAQFGQAPAGYVAGRGRGMGDLARGNSELTPAQTQQEVDRGDYSESNYDEFSGYGEKLFTAGTYEEDDAEADQIYDKVDGIMESRRKRSREQQMLLEKKRAKSERPRIADQFADLKRELGGVSAEQWEAIPEVGDHSLKLKQSRKKESFMPVPDSLIEAAQRATTGGAAMVQSVDPSSLEASGLMSSLSGLTSTVGGSRGTALTKRLDQLGDSVSGQTVVDPKGYLTSLNSIKVNSSAEVGDIQKARILLQSVTSTNPKHGPGWIAAARVEEFAGKMPAARKIILHGCEQCPESEDVWLEAARLHPADMAKALLANAVLQLPTSVKIWLAAADLENQEARKKAVLRRSLEFVPNAVSLWKAAIELENVTDARIMLARAVECVPHSVEMWLALAKLETHENARKVLNQARQAVPTERATWVTAAKLEEANGNAHLVPRIVEKMVVSLAQYQVIISRDAWIKEAMDCEAVGALVTCAAIIRNTVQLGVDAEDLLITLMGDAADCLKNEPPAVETARAIFNYAIEKYPHKEHLWLQAVFLEKDHGTAASTESRLREAVKHCPRDEILWLIAAKQKWLADDLPGARDILREAFAAIPTSQQIWLAAIKLEWENSEFERARALLTKAREHASCEAVWLKSALLERELGNPQGAVALLLDAIKIEKYRHFAKFYMMAGQIYSEELNELAKAFAIYQAGLKVDPQSVPLWQLLIRLAEKKGVTKARPICSEARMKLPKNDLIWLEYIRLERRCGDKKQADSLMAQALQDCPHSGALWAEELLTCPKERQKSRSIDALKACVDDPLVLIAVGRLFERGGRVLKARRRFDRALALNPRLGDGWCYYYAMEYVHLYKAQLLTAGVLGRGGGSGGGSAGSAAAGTGVGMGVASSAEGSRLSDKDRLLQFGGLDSVDDAEEDEPVAAGGAAITDITSSGSGSSGGSSASGSAAQAQQQLSAALDATEDSILDVIERKVQDVCPNQGELWCSVTKETKNRRLPPAAALRVVAERILGYPLSLHASKVMVNGKVVNSSNN